MIEFDDVADDDGADDEDLPQPPERAPTRRRRVLAVTAVVLAAAGLIAYGQFTKQRSHPADAPSSTSPAPSIPVPAPSDGGLLIEHQGDRDGTLRNDVVVSVPSRLTPPACPQSTDGFASCVVVPTVPPALAKAVSRRFPTALKGTASTATLRATDSGSRPGLWYRLYRAPLGRYGTLTILVTRYESGYDLTPTVFLSDSTTIAYVRHVTTRYEVQVQVRAPTAHAPSLEGFSALAADPRLTAS